MDKFFCGLKLKVCLAVLYPVCSVRRLADSKEKKFASSSQTRYRIRAVRVIIYNLKSDLCWKVVNFLPSSNEDVFVFICC